MARTISDHNFDITFARISTERGVALDTFYVENSMGGKHPGLEEMAGLREAVLKAVAHQ